VSLPAATPSRALNETSCNQCGPLANDFVSDAQFERLLAAWFGNMARVLEPGRGFYIWGGYANCANYPPVLKATGLYFSQSIIWVKEHPVLTRKDFMGNHEWCFMDGSKAPRISSWVPPTPRTSGR
jgi:DNA modification methylase